LTGAPTAAPADAPVAVCMATHNPDPALFKVQVDSLRAQEGCEWHCFISDDCSSEESVRRIEAEVGDDARFTFSRSGRRLGFYRNFERALGMVTAGFGTVALCDQDDRWYPDKLRTLRDRLGPARLIFSDQRLVREDGTVISDTYWSDRRNNFDDLISLLVANTVTGAASLFPRELLDVALPFPEVPGEEYHDHWLALCALATGEIRYVDRPLYDYVQHGGAVLGHDAANAGLMSQGWLRLDPRRWRDIIGGWGSAYFDVVLRLKALAQILLDRGGDRVPPAKRRRLERFVRAERSPLGPVWMGLRPLRRLAGRNETLGSERIVARGILWRHLAAVKRRLPDRFSRTVAAPAALRPEKEVTDQMRRKVAPLVTEFDEKEPVRINLLIPTIDLEHLFGGYIAKFNLARRLAEEGAAVRLVTVDPTPPLPTDWQGRVESFNGLEGLFDRVEIAFARDGDLLRLNPSDSFIATTWWTAHIASRLVSESSRSRFLYLIQEYEPITVPEGAWRDLAAASYELPHAALFSTDFLRGYFESRRIGVYAGDEPPPPGDSLVFRNAITRVPEPDAAELAGRSALSILFYARPEAHAARNLYGPGLEALRRASAEGVIPEDARVAGIGATGQAGRVELTDGRFMEVLPRTGQEAYGRFLAGFDVGIGLMDAPHPSLVPIEMASAGLVTLTTTYEGRTPEQVKAISRNLIAVTPSVEGLVGGLARAIDSADDIEARIEGSKVDWSRDWTEAFDGDLLARVRAVLEAR
jgi:glycosyltransferase involved in cell wall biosynthesis